MKKPIGLYVVATGYLLAALATFIEGFWVTESFYPHHYLFMLLYPAVAYGVFKVRRWGWYLIVGHIGALLVSNVMLSIWLGDLRPRLLLELNLLFVFFLWYFLRRSVRSPFHNPALRWWERQHPRYGAVFAAKVRRGEGEGGLELDGEGINLSMGGCFVELLRADELNHGDEVRIELQYEDFEPFRCSAKVTWLTEPDSENPRGAGIQFAKIDRVNRALLKGIIAVVKSRWLRQGKSEDGR